MAWLKLKHLLLIVTISYLIYKYRFYLTLGAVILRTFLSGLHSNGLSDTDLKIKEEAKLETNQLIKHYGYKPETYTVITTDGYLLKTFRIPFGKNNKTRNGIPILLQHGSFGSSSVWTSKKEQSLAFILADKGFDVWLGNFRGNRYNKRHQNLTLDNRLFWEGGFETNVEDCTAIIHYILHKTKYDQILVMGHSLGATALSATIAQPTIKEKIKGAILLGLATAPRYFTSFITILLDGINLFPTLLKSIFYKSVLPHTITDGIIEKYCSSSSPEFCLMMAGLIAGPDFSNFVNKTRLQIYVRNSVSGTSMFVLYHWAQLRNKYELSAYDYGRKRNVEVYGQANQMIYSDNECSVPIAIFQWPNDPLGTPIDTELYIRHIPNLVYRELFPRADASHLDFLFSDSPHLVSKILILLNDMRNNRYA